MRTPFNSQHSFQRNAAYVALGHFGAIVALCLLPMVPGIFQRPSEQVTMIDFVVDPRTEKGDGGTPEDEPEAPEPESAPEAPLIPPPPPAAPKPDAMPPPPKPEVKKDEKPKPKEEKKAVEKPKLEKKPIQVSKEKVRKPVGTQNPLTKEEIARRMGMGARLGTYNSAIPSEDQLALGKIRDALYRAWAQPSRESVGGRTVGASITMDLDGRIVERRITRRSGIAEFDQSVDQALHAIDRIPGLTTAFVREHRTVSITFEVK